MSSAISYRPEVDGLRAIAVVPVVLFHAGVPGFSGGYVGVDVFFVISGFLITSIIRRELDGEGFSLARFYERRARRILPALFAVIAFSSMVGLWMLGPQELQAFGHSILATMLFGSNVYFYQALDGYFVQTADVIPLLHTWSLAIEEQFYLVVPLVLMAAWRFGRRFALLLVLIAVAGSFALSCLTLESYRQATFFLLPTRAWELGIGSALALSNLGAVRATRPVCEAVSAAGLSGILVPVVAYEATTLFPGMAALPVCLGAAAVIWAGRDCLVGRVLSSGAPVAIGLVSYSLYLWHWPILAFMRLSLPDGELPAVMALAAILLSGGCAWLSYRFVEQPFRRLQARRARVLPVAGLSLASVAAFGIALNVSGGLPGRFAPELQAAYAAATDEVEGYDSCFPFHASRGFCSLAAEPAPLPKVLVWGDSHAAALAEGLESYLRERRFEPVYAVQFGCAPLKDMAAKGHRRESCLAHNEAVLKRLATSDIDWVILHARWLHNARPVGEGARLAPAGQPSAGSNADLLEKGLLATVEALEDLGKRVIVLGPVPELDFDVHRAQLAHLRFGHEAPRGSSAAAFAEEAEAVTNALRRIERRTEARVVALSGAFCGERCRIADGGVPLYKDHNHVTGDAGVMIMAHVSDELDRALGLAQPLIQQASTGQGASGDELDKKALVNRLGLH